MNRALFLNGVFVDVLEEILAAQKSDKDLVCYLQPYSGRIIKFLEKNDFNKNPSITFYISTTTNLNQICYTMHILMIMNTHSYDREHLLYSRIGSGVFLL